MERGAWKRFLDDSRQRLRQRQATGRDFLQRPITSSRVDAGGKNSVDAYAENS